ncbi:MAG: DSD1 family PLP-dependent enzyme [Hyphomicrobiaceae bacterium]
MPPFPPARPGDPFDRIDTPALVVDLDAMERNLTAMATFAARAGVRLRPHAKTHKSPLIAARQIALGAVGQCCQKVSEAAVLIEGGVRDVLVTNQIWGTAKLDRLAALARQAKVGVCVDEAANVDALCAAAERLGATIEVLVEIDVGGRRCGVDPGADAVALARRIVASPGLTFGGLQAYFGTAQHRRTPAERRDAIAAAGQAVRTTLEALAGAGLVARTVGGAGTGTFRHEAASGLWNELQTGSYVFMDADYALNEPDPDNDAPRFEHALFVLTGVLSARGADRAVVDAGHKALGNDSGFPVIWRRPDLSYSRPADEHGAILVSPGGSRPAPGERLLLVPGHCDPTVNLHDWYVGVRGLGSGRDGCHVECVWPVAARGAVL